MGGSFMYPFFRDYLPASSFHDIWLRYLIPSDTSVTDQRLETKAIFTTLSTPIGVASGVDFDAIAFSKLLSLGLGFVEIGPVAPTAERFGSQFYSITENSLQVIGPITTFGALWVKRKLIENSLGVRGVNLTPLKENVDSVPHLTDIDYVHSISKLYHLVDFFTVNLCGGKFRKIGYYKKPQRYQELLGRISAQRNLEIGLFAANETGIIKESEDLFRRLYTPIYVKIDSDWEDLDGLIEACKKFGIDGLVVGDENQDVSKSREILQKAVKLGEGLEIISFGGIQTGSEALERIKMGAKLVQIFEILLEKGPGEYFRIHQELLEALTNEGFKDVSEAFNFYNKTKT